ncbi:hypothetical protein F5Y06DRAFT_247343 [Hypoxylon sp. FL0890]|nr:hypothetical protein F5Y06DRAFT_247343 [Hypoxylon sp. FL0890]
MTTPVSGSSLPQARDVHQHNHFHNSRDSHNRHHHTYHTHHHARSQNSNPKKGHKRTDSDEPTIIVETVSVLQLIDSTGAILTLQTLSPSEPTPATTTASDTGLVSALGFPSSSSTTSDDDGDGLPSTTSIPTIDPTVAPSESSMPTSFPTLSYSPLTSAPLSGSPVFPSLAGVTNTTQGPSSLGSSSSLFSNSTSSVLSFSAESINTSSVSVSVLAGSSFSGSSTSTSATTTTSSESTSTSGSSFGSPTSSGTDGGGFIGGNAQPSSSSTSTTDGASGSSDGPGAATVAGSVLGGVAALAFILILALGFLRWKKRQNTLRLMRGSTSERGPGGALVGNSGPGGGDGAMSERRRSVPFAIPAALANLTGHKRFSGRSAASSDGGERGFSKVSGRKLPPVIQFGGDGYTDPRATILSDQSIEYRDSQAFPGLKNLGPTRLAVGAPMRPESGIPVYNPGPARTPIHEQAPFSPYTDDTHLEPPSRDPLGRSHPSHDGSSRSHGSASRFTEAL